ncbi:MAG: VIT family protein [Gammaproteobacteria bacterium]|jgi:VIT1/CCC1 family predicted Fe2+/Mn2+ transporter|nr:VIT family protein [Gammaproteobacteria bacterium]MBK8990742.1 VIT family protein [Gammaproteobacteria bacterium]MBK9466710.1 VIT family protein [Gammaproteobacteria bacterium]MBP6482878.1 VIT family protein [Pseudomonadales bacterium]MBP7910443.1 VIT family protein [Pseudomonadales bacterium]
MRHGHRESHRGERIGWLRAAVLGANDGTISVASLVVGVAAAGASQDSLLLTGVAGLVAGAMSMAAGEYVSVQSQADTEAADMAKERNELEAEPERELAELAAIYIGRGLDEPLARQVAEKLTAGDALAAHARDELGITETLRARPVQAAFASAAAFCAGAIIPILTALLAPAARVAEVSSLTSLAALLVFGGLAGYAGGASITKGALRVAFWGAFAMGLTAVVGRLFGAAV